MDSGSRRKLVGLALMTAALAADNEVYGYHRQRNPPDRGKQPKRHIKTQLTGKQQKARSKSKQARKARRK